MRYQDYHDLDGYENEYDSSNANSEDTTVTPDYSVSGSSDTSEGFGALIFPGLLLLFSYGLLVYLACGQNILTWLSFLVKGQLLCGF